MERIQTGNGGNISHVGENVEPEANGGSIFGIMTSISTIDINQFEFRDVQTGNGGQFDGARNESCRGGRIELSACLVRCSVTVQDESPYLLNVLEGNACAAAPITTTTGEVSTTSTTTTPTSSTTTEPPTTSESTTTTSTTTTSTTYTTTTETATTTGTSSITDTSSTTSTTSSSTSLTSSTSGESTTSTTGSSGGTVPPNLSGIRTTKTRNSVILFWDTPIETRRSLFATYNINVDFSVNNLTWTNRCTGNNNQCTISGLSPNTMYYFRLAAVDGSTGVIGNYTLLQVTTDPKTKPAPPQAPRYSALYRTTINLIWTPNDDGGRPISHYLLQMSSNGDTGWVDLYNSSLPLHPFCISNLYIYIFDSRRYSVNDLEMSATYFFRVSASNDLGNSNFSLVSNITTAYPYCGDGKCDNGDTCNSCFLDCPTCGYLPCPGSPECSGRGSCVKGVCNCNSGWGGLSCSLSSAATPPIVIEVNNTSPSATVDLDPTHPSQGVRFIVSFFSIYEINRDGSFGDRYLFSEQNFTLSRDFVAGRNETVYSTTLPNLAIVNISISVFLEPAQVIFANQTIQMSANTLKSISNKVVATMEYEAETMQSDECTSVDTGKDQSDSLRWFNYDVNGAVLYGRFEDAAEVDERVGKVQFNYNSTSSLFEITVPHFWNRAAFDPDFSVLFDTESAEQGCEGAIKDTKNKNTAMIAGITVGVVCGVALLTGAVIYAMKRKRKARFMKRLTSKYNKHDHELDTLPLDKVTSTSPMYQSNENSNPFYSK